MRHRPGKGTLLVRTCWSVAVFLLRLLRSGSRLLLHTVGLGQHPIVWFAEA